MKLTLKRPLTCGSNATIGALYVDGVPECVTLEDVVRERDGEPVEKWKVQNCTAIPRGTYPVTITMSKRFGRPLPLLMNVPGFSGVRIHPGNTDKDTEGCILVGTHALTDDFVSNSRQAFSVLFAKIERAVTEGKEVTIEIV